MSEYQNEYQYELPNVIDARKEDWKIEIIQDNTAENPRTACDNWIGEFLVSERCRYVKNEFTDRDKICFFNYKRDKKALEKLGYIVFPVSVYDHSGAIMFIGKASGFDCGCIGFYVVNKEKYRKEHGITRISRSMRNKIADEVKFEVGYYSHWMEGEVYGFKIYRNGEELDSCWDFINSFPKVVEDMYDYFPAEFKNAFSIEEAKEMAKLV